MKTLIPFKLFIILISALMGSALPARAHNPTWTNGIACIIYSHCTNCHNPKGIAPFSLMTYEDVYANRYSVAASVKAKSMPPYPATQEKMKYAHANTLSDHEIDEIADWVNNFAPLGDASKIPAPPNYSSQYQITAPDFTAQIPTYTVTSNNDVYRMFVLPVNNTTTRTIQSIEVFPGNREIVHHALVFYDTSTIPFNLDNSDPLPGYSAFGGTGSSSSKLLTGYTPGQGAFSFAPGFGIKLLPNSYIILQMHYPGGVSGQRDSTQVRIKYGASNLRDVTTIAALNHNTSLTNGPLMIPANTVKTFYSQVNNSINRTLTGIMPHMHLVGTSIKAWCVTPTKDTIHLIDIPKWDFHWQYFYQFQKPLFIPAGSIIYGEATYDNTSSNPNNPNNPPKDVKRGEGTEDEMMLIYMNLSTYAAGDENIVIDTASHFTHDASCFQSMGIHLPAKEESWQYYLDESGNLLHIEAEEPCTALRIIAPNGREVLRMSGTDSPVNLSSLAPGVYILRMQTAAGRERYGKFIRP